MTSEGQFSLFPESGDQMRSALHGFEAVTGELSALANGIEAQVGDLVFFEISPDGPNGIEFRRIDGQPGNGNIDSSGTTPSQRPSGNSESVRGARVPSSNTSIERRHASSCEELISPRYSTCRCSTRPPLTRLFSTTLQ